MITDVLSALQTSLLITNLQYNASLESIALQISDPIL